MARSTKSGSPQEPFYLIVRDKRGNIYFVSPDRLGSPIQQTHEIRKAIDAYSDKTHVDFAAIVSGTDLIVGVCRNSGGHPNRKKPPRPPRPRRKLIPRLPEIEE
jgi:hypothetical protein